MMAATIQKHRVLVAVLRRRRRYVLMSPAGVQGRKGGQVSQAAQHSTAATPAPRQMSGSASELECVLAPCAGGAHGDDAH